MVLFLVSYSFCFSSRKLLEFKNIVFVKTNSISIVRKIDGFSNFVPSDFISRWMELRITEWYFNNIGNNLSWSLLVFPCLVWKKRYSIDSVVYYACRLFAAFQLLPLYIPFVRDLDAFQTGPLLSQFFPHSFFKLRAIRYPIDPSKNSRKRLWNKRCWIILDVFQFYLIQILLLDSFIRIMNLFIIFEIIIKCSSNVRSNVPI